MRKNNIKYLSILILAFAIIGCGKKKEEKNEIIRPVVVLDLAKENMMQTDSFPGMVVAKNDTVLAFKVPGSIESINVVAGDYVKKGDIIAHLSTSDYNVNLKANKEKYLAAKAQYDNMLKQFKRAKTLHDGKAMSDKNFDIVEAQFKGSKAIYLANLEGFKNAQNKLDDTYLRAPYDGYISNKLLDEGSVVSAATPVVSIVSDGIKKVEINVAGKDLNKFREDLKYKFVVNNASYDLKLVKVGQNTDLLKLTYPVTLEFMDKLSSDKMVSGTTGEIEILENKNANKDIVVPLTSLFENDGTYVYVYKDGKAIAKKVELGKFCANGNIVITKGLDMNDIVITAGSHTIENGQKVKILPKASPTNVGDVL